MKPGDLILWRDQRFGRHRLYEVHSVLHGALGQESLIRLQCLNEKPGLDEDGAHHVTTLVPEPLIRNAEIYSRVEEPQP